MSSTNDSQQYEFMRREDEEMSADEDSDNRQNPNAYMLREQDRFLPICNIIKIMKIPVPENGKIAKDARECIQECVSEFISFITSEAIERSMSENRKTVNGDDLLYAFATLGFDNYVEPLGVYLHKFREATKCDRNLLSENSMLQDDSSNDIRYSAASSENTSTPNEAAAASSNNQNNENFEKINKYENDKSQVNTTLALASSTSVNDQQPERSIRKISTPLSSNSTCHSLNMDIEQPSQQNNIVIGQDVASDLLNTTMLIFNTDDLMQQQQRTNQDEINQHSVAAQGTISSVQPIFQTINWPPQQDNRNNSNDFCGDFMF